MISALQWRGWGEMNVHRARLVAGAAARTKRSHYHEPFNYGASLHKPQNNV